MKVKIAKIKNIVYEKDNYINTNYTGLAKFIYYFNHKLLEFGFSKKIYNLSSICITHTQTGLQRLLTLEIQQLR